VPASITFSVMNRDYIAARSTLILLLLIFQKFLHTFLFEFLEVFNHAHVVAHSVTPVQMVKVFAGHVVALETEFDFVLGEFLAASLDVAVFASGKTTSTMGYFASFLEDSS
jgi:hypothetical protein